MITLHYEYLVFAGVTSISIIVFLFIRAHKITIAYKNYRTDKDKEMGEIVDRILRGSEDNLNLFFKFEAGMVENIRLARTIKDMGFKSEHLHAEIIKLLEYIKAK